MTELSAFNKPGSCVGAKMLRKGWDDEHGRPQDAAGLLDSLQHTKVGLRYGVMIC